MGEGLPDKLHCKFWDQDTHEFLWEETIEWMPHVMGSDPIEHDGKKYASINAYMSTIRTDGLDVWVREFDEKKN